MICRIIVEARTSEINRNETHLKSHVKHFTRTIRTHFVALFLSVYEERRTRITPGVLLRNLISVTGGISHGQRLKKRGQRLTGTVSCEEIMNVRRKLKLNANTASTQIWKFYLIKILI